ncbi:MAG: hypothetical protein JWP23_1705 [Phenylobacterium sp.]|nr:hypothetical protein [Phenylobacterium sp.]
MIKRFLAPALLLTLAACASDHPRGHGPGGRGGPGGPGGPPRVRLFISPSGEPFRGEDGLGHWLAQADADHDGAVTLAEFRADAQHSFKFLDTNGDGVIDGFELQHYERDIVPEIGVMTFDERPTPAARPSGGGGRGGGGGGRGGRGGGGMGGGGGRGGGQGGGSGSDNSSSAQAQQTTKAPAAGREGAARYSLINEPEPISAADANLDGKVTLAEWMAITDRRFARLDHDKSGRLTRDSLLKIQPKGQRDALKKP